MLHMNNSTEALFKWVTYHFFNQHPVNSIAMAMDVWQPVMKACKTKFEQILNGSYVVTPTPTHTNLINHIKSA